MVSKKTSLVYPLCENLQGISLGGSCKDWILCLSGRNFSSCIKFSWIVDSHHRLIRNWMVWDIFSSPSPQQKVFKWNDIVLPPSSAAFLALRLWRTTFLKITAAASTALWISASPSVVLCYSERERSYVIDLICEEKNIADCLLASGNPVFGQLRDSIDVPKIAFQLAIFWDLCHNRGKRVGAPMSGDA